MVGPTLNQRPGTVTYHRGNIVHDTADILFNTVNTVGVMGKGVALAFKTAFPAIMPAYLADCRSRALTAGSCLLYPLPIGRASVESPSSPVRLWAALATKAHWRDASRIGWIGSGLTALADLAAEAGARSIAIPPPGCGNGGLDWHAVEPLVLDILLDFDLRIYASPSRRPD
ncbi:macro domain-containing protein [Sphingomonas paeninsulae]|nr:macro domain-containing protein [Sphingomonas paeninsulae]